MKTINRIKIIVVVVIVLALGLALALCRWKKEDQPGHVLDEAKAAGRGPETFPAADEDYFQDMDGKATLQPDEYFQDAASALGVSPAEVRRSVVKGRNTWIVWTGGNDRFWDEIGVRSFGTLDLLKTISSYDGPINPSGEKMKFSRDNRWYYLGLVNEPCFDKPSGPDPKRFGLWLDVRSPDCAPDPFENEAKYPGVKTGARGRTVPVGSYYGYATGIVGLRLFPNPAFDEAAAKHWDPVRYYNDPSYYNDKDLVRPYRVGMSCAFCHVGPDPTRPPADPEHPKWENLSSNVGAQYFWIDRIFSWQADPATYMFQMFHTSRPGTLDTSLVSTDNINNPRTMNAIYNLGARLDQAKRFGKETLGGGSLNNAQFNSLVPAGSPLAQFFNAPDTVYAPRVLKDASDSVGALGALNRVYINIGLFSEEWLLHFNPLVGGKKTTPIQIADARKNSTYWLATEQQTPDMAVFFLKTTPPHKLKDAPGGAAFMTTDTAVLDRGKVVFAENCARCHSSKLPTPAEGLDPGGCAGPDYMNCWNKYWAWTKTDDFKSKMREIVMAPDFLDNNYLSAEHRVPVTLLQTNACSPLATNAIRDNIWDNFSSETYKNLPSVGTITIFDPVTGDPKPYEMPAGGRGYTRPASLVSLWSTAPFLLNNSVGKFNPSPSVEARMDSFNDSIEKMLWPEKRERDSVLGDKVPGMMDRTTERSYIVIKSGFIPDSLKGLLGWGEWLFPNWFGDGGDIKIGPIPPGTPVGLIANLDFRPDDASLGGRLGRDKKLLELVVEIKRKLKELGPNATDQQAQDVLRPLTPRLMELSKCPDYIVNRGHYFGTGLVPGEPGLSDEDKRALIEFLKTF